MTELGYPDVYLDGWFGIAGPASLPEGIIQTLHGKFASVLHSPDLNRRLKEQGWVVDPISPDEFRTLIKSDIVRLGQLLKDTGATLNESAQ